ncbi:MAG: TIM barrel protein [Oscillospiraceae bacterium]|jgi:hydroxypyruvate isomerase|nr:TIM barrel protein [Oscillospiraceae bacterium]
MLKLSACVELLFRSEPMADRFLLAANAGVQACEIWNYTRHDIAELKEGIEKSGIPLSTMCVGATNPELAEEYAKHALLSEESGDILCRIAEESVKTASILGVSNLILTTGQERDDISRYEQHANLVCALRKAAPIFESAGITAVLEPLNVVKNHRGYYLFSAYEAFAVIREVQSPRVKLLYDIYHQQLTDGNLIANITGNIDLIGHFHVADAPGRNEPGTGEINYKNVFAAIASTSYQHYVGLEYTPLQEDAAALKETLSLAGYN